VPSPATWLAEAATAATHCEPIAEEGTAWLAAGGPRGNGSGALFGSFNGGAVRGSGNGAVRGNGNGGAVIAEVRRGPLFGASTAVRTEEVASAAA